MLEFIQRISTVNAPLLKKKKKIQSLLYCLQTETTLVWQLMVNKFGLIHIPIFFMSFHFISNLPLNKERSNSNNK